MFGYKWSCPITVPAAGAPALLSSLIPAGRSFPKYGLFELTINWPAGADAVTFYSGSANSSEAAVWPQSAARPMLFSPGFLDSTNAKALYVVSNTANTITASLVCRDSLR